MSRRAVRRGFDLLAVALLLVLVAAAIAAVRGQDGPTGTATAFTLPASDGGTVVFATPPGRFTVLEFGASWCEPCRRAAPILVRFAADHPDVALVSVDEGEARPEAAAFARAEGIRRMALDADGAVGSRYDSRGLPTIVAIDARGRIRAHFVGDVPGLAVALGRLRRTASAGRSLLH